MNGTTGKEAKYVFLIKTVALNNAHYSVARLQKSKRLFPTSD